MLHSLKMEVIDNPKDLAQAYTIFKKGKLAMAMGQYDQAIDLLRQTYNLIGEDGLISMDHQLVGLVRMALFPWIINLWAS